MSSPDLFEIPQFSLDQPTKTRLLVEQLNALHEHHLRECEDYERLMAVLAPGFVAARELADVPFVPVSLFKSRRLVSVADADIFKTLTSSGTSGEVSRIYLDRETARLQAVALAKIMTSALGPKRLPMIVVDTPDVIRDRREFSARGAGILGMINFGRHHFFALDEHMHLDEDGLSGFLHEHGREPFLIFGFTYMVWQYLLKATEERGIDLSNGILVHGGGWKKLEEESVGNREFKDRLRASTGLQRVFNYYGMVEQVGSVFLEGEDGFLYCPTFADIVIRQPGSWCEAEIGEVGVIQVISSLPRSYPGHSLLTEDLGVVHGIDDSSCGRGGKRFRVVGRAPRAQLRGCSDTHAFERAG